MDSKRNLQWLVLLWAWRYQLV
uniref:Uncharacterized protein n=1 Tax=Anguilla anguilla TaxID=7936 RepID=A0A0E9P6C7_ANGAN